MMGEFVATILLGAEMAHRAHLRAQGEGSHARHVALADFYSSVRAVADNLAETYQGHTLKLLDIPIKTAATEDIESALKKQMRWLEARRFDACDVSESPIQNIIDEALGHYKRTIYKLHFLR